MLEGLPSLSGTHFELEMIGKSRSFILLLNNEYKYK